MLLQPILGVDFGERSNTIQRNLEGSTEKAKLISNEPLKLQQFRKFFETTKIERSTIKGITKKAADRIQQATKIGEQLQTIYNRLEYKYKAYLNDIDSYKKTEAYKNLKNNNESSSDKKEKTITPKDRVDSEIELMKLYEQCKEAGKCIGEYFKQSSKEYERYNNPWSLAQVYNILETDLHGFSKIALSEQKENNWRSAMIRFIDTNEKTGKSMDIAMANASRLTNDSVRLIDGFLRRVLEDQVQYIVSTKLQQLKTTGVLDLLKSKNTFTELNLPILIEENKFLFQEGLSELKKGKGTGNEERTFETKDERIKTASNNICAYTGKSLEGSKGEIDHIISRSSSSATQEVYNHEANLIYVSNEGNQKKGNQVYTLSNINKEYLQKQFGTADIHSIQLRIETEFHRVKENAGEARNIKFHSLSPDDQKIIRHAGFVDSLRGDFLSLIQQRSSTQVNGVQALLAKKVISVLKKKIEQTLREASLSTEEVFEKMGNILFQIFAINSRDISNMRYCLAQTSFDYTKQEQQAPYSHIIDALLTIPTFLETGFAKKVEVLDMPSLVANLSNPSLKIEALHKFVETTLPKELAITRVKNLKSYEKTRIASKKMFKETLYREHFKPILYTITKESKEELRIGFTIEQSKEFKFKEGKKEYSIYEIYTLLQEFLSTTKRIKKTKQGSALEHRYLAFDSLQEAKKVLETDISKKYIWFSIDKQKAFQFFKEYSLALKEGSVSEQQTKQYSLLKEFHYLTKKVSVIDDKNKLKEDIGNELPSFKTWKGLQEQVDVHDKNKQERVLRTYLGIENKGRKRGKVRKKYSLPIKAYRV